MKIEFIKADLIDIDDKTLLISPESFDEKLVRSIEQIGLLNPVKLIREKDKFKVITGWKRLDVCWKLGIEEILSQVYDFNELSKEDILNIIYFDNVGRLTELEKAELIAKYKSYALLEDDEIIKNILPLYGINFSRKKFQKYLKISRLEIRIKEAFYNEKLSFEQLQMLSEIENSVLRADIYDCLLSKYKFNNNETRDLLKDVVEILNRDKVSLRDLIKTLIKTVGAKAAKNDLRKELKAVRSPNLSKAEKLYKSSLEDVDFPDEIKIKHHPYFESNEIEFNFRVKNSKNLKDNLTELLIKIEDGKIDKLLKIVREGK